MSRYIDADTLEEKAKQYSLGYYEADEWAVPLCEINEAPSIDTEPKRGEWAKRTHNTLIAQVNFAYCSECGQPIMHEHTRPLWSFCPNCGADMREREGE